MAVWRRTTRTRIGLDYGSRRFKAAQLSGAGGRWRIEAAVEMPRATASPLPEPGEVKQLCDLLARSGFTGRSLVVAVPENKVISGVLELPPRASGAPLDVLARTELARMHKRSPEAFEMTSWDLPAPARAANSTFVMAAGLDHADATALMDVFEGQGFDVECLTTHAVAVTAACGTLLDKPGELAAILDLGWTSSRILLMHQTVVVYERALVEFGLAGLVGRLGGDQAAEGRLWAEGVAGKADVSVSVKTHFQRLAGELRIALSYLANQYSDAELAGLFLTGGGADLPGLAALLESILDVPVQAVRPSELGECPPSLARQCGPAFVDAVGLCRLEGR
jgi:Tfp pilus assembly PilM family ATPase